MGSGKTVNFLAFSPVALHQSALTMINACHHRMPSFIYLSHWYFLSFIASFRFHIYETVRFHFVPRAGKTVNAALSNCYLLIMWATWDLTVFDLSYSLPRHSMRSLALLHPNYYAYGPTLLWLSPAHEARRLCQSPHARWMVRRPLAQPRAVRQGPAAEMQTYFI